MNALKYIVVNIVETLLRVFPIPCKMGLVRTGKPERDSPVLLTGNYHLTVQRVKHVLRGVDAYLLVANSRGINVWCAATGGRFTTHDVISVLKTSGIEDLVDHRAVILPQLAATGVESNVIKKRTGWNIVWGPVYAKDIPAFVQNSLMKTREMREVEFPWAQRIEMAVAWAFPISLITSVIIAPFWREAILPLAGVVWSLSLFIFLAFPLYSRYLGGGEKRKGFVFFDFGRGGFQLLLWLAVTVGFILYSILIGDYPTGFIVRWSFMLLVVVLILSLDLMGSTPVFKSGLHEDSLLKVILDVDRCKGADFCEQVCPRNCYELESSKHIVTMPRARQCVQCGACIVQCPFDALFFEGPKGEIILPETVRRFKLNLIGKRVVKMK